MKTSLADLVLFSKAIDLRVQRQELIASNIANADTPNFKARDFDFKSALQQAMQSQLSMSSTTSGHLDGARSPVASPAAQYRANIQGSVDGNRPYVELHIRPRCGSTTIALNDCSAQ